MMTGETPPKHRHTFRWHIFDLRCQCGARRNPDAKELAAFHHGLRMGRETESDLEWERRVLAARVRDARGRIVAKEKR